MNLNEQIQQATDAFISEQLPALVQTKVSKMVDEVLGDIFRSYGDTAKKIKTKIEEGLDINLQHFGLVDYNALIGKAVSDRLAFLVQDQAIKPILQMVDDAVKYQAKKKVNLSEIHEMIKQASMEKNDTDVEGEFSFHVVEDEKHNWHTISIDLEADKKEKDCGISFLVSGSGGNIFCFKAGNFMQSQKEITPARLTMLDSIELKIFRLYAAQVEVIIDETYFENEWDRYN